jgi:hypothetical protein
MLTKFACSKPKLRNYLRNYLRRFEDCFQRSDTRGHLSVYVEGQLSDLPRKNCEPIADAVLSPHRRRGAGAIVVAYGTRATPLAGTHRRNPHRNPARQRRLSQKSSQTHDTPLAPTPNHTPRLEQVPVG